MFRALLANNLIIHDCYSGLDETSCPKTAPPRDTELEQNTRKPASQPS